jgi:hypothetical protein
MVHVVDVEGVKFFTKADGGSSVNPAASKKTASVVVARQEVEVLCGDDLSCFQEGATALKDSAQKVEKPLPVKKSEAVKFLRRELKRYFNKMINKHTTPNVSAPRVLIGQETRDDYWHLDTHTDAAHYVEQCVSKDVKLCTCRRCTLVKAGMMWADISSKRVDLELLLKLHKAAEQAEPAAPDDQRPAVGGARTGGMVFGLSTRLSAWLYGLYRGDLKRDSLTPGDDSTDTGADTGGTAPVAGTKKSRAKSEKTSRRKQDESDFAAAVARGRRSHSKGRQAPMVLVPVSSAVSDTQPEQHGDENFATPRGQIALDEDGGGAGGLSHQSSLRRFPVVHSNNSTKRRAVVRFRLEKALARQEGGRLDDKLLSGDIVCMDEDDDATAAANVSSTADENDGPAERWELEWRPKSIAQQGTDVPSSSIEESGQHHPDSDEGWQRRDELPEAHRPDNVELEAEDLEFLPNQTTVVALHDFTPVRGQRDLGLKFGDRVIAIDHGNKPWWLGYLENDPDKRLGEFPSNYCQAAIIPPIRTEADEWSVSKKEKMRREEHFLARGDRNEEGENSMRRKLDEDLPPLLRRNEVGHGSKTVMLEVVSGYVACRAYTEYMQVDIGAVTSGITDESGSPMQTTMWLLAMLQFYFVVLDRAFFLRKAVAAKLILLWASIVVYCTIIFSMWDFNAPRSFSYLGLWLLLKCAYWYICGIQIRHGFGDTVTNFSISALTVSTAKPNHYAFILFDNTPFLSEICCILEWTCHKTTLELVDALKLDRMKSVTYLAKCRWARLQEANRAPGAPQPFSIKLTFGIATFFILSLLIWGPALLMASLSKLVTYQVHNVESASVQMDLVLQGTPQGQGVGASGDLSGNFTVRLFESSFHSVRAMSTDPAQLLSEPTLSTKFLEQYASYGSGSKDDSSGFWWGPREKVFADQVQDLLVSGSADQPWQPSHSVSNRVSRYLGAVGAADAARRTTAKIILTITLLKQGTLGSVERVVFPGSEYDSWTSRTGLDATQALTLQSLLTWGQQLTVEEDQQLDADEVAAAAAAAADVNGTSAESAAGSSSGARLPSRCIFEDEIELSTRRSLSLKLDSAYPALLFVENDGTVYPMDSRQHQGECVAPFQYPCPASAAATSANAVEIWLERRAVGAPSWRMSQSGIDVTDFSWQEHCGVAAATATGAGSDGADDDATAAVAAFLAASRSRCLDGCIRMRPAGSSGANSSATTTAAGGGGGGGGGLLSALGLLLPEDDDVGEGAVLAGSDGIAIGIFNAKKPDAIGDAVLGFGLIGLYATFVFSISKTIKAVTYKMMHDILYTDMEKTGFVWAKIRDIYRARALARMCGASGSSSKITTADGEEIDFYYIEERLWLQVHAIFRDASKLFKLTSAPEHVNVTVGYLPRDVRLQRAMTRRTTLQNPKILVMSYSSKVSELMVHAVEALGLGTSGTSGNTIKEYELRWYIAARQMVDSDKNPM